MSGAVAGRSDLYVVCSIYKRRVFYVELEENSQDHQPTSSGARVTQGRSGREKVGAERLEWDEIQRSHK